VAHYIAIIEDGRRITPWASGFPTYPAARLLGTTLTRHCAPEALELYPEGFDADGKPMPRPRALTELNGDREAAFDIKTYMVALIELPARAHAAE
jgi:hypothetical protein